MNKEEFTILVTNDDGISAKGINELIEAVKEFGRVVVVAANRSFSGMSHAITSDMPLHIQKVNEVDNVEYYQTNGTPADNVKIAINHLLKSKPDLVVSGINHGTNSTTCVHYSGTLGAAREGALHNIPSVGFSLLDFLPDADFTESKKVANLVVKELINSGMPKWTFYNVNIPCTKVKGIKVGRMADANWVEDLVENTDPRGKKYYWLSGTMVNSEPDADDTDEYFLKNGYASLVPCKVDVTDYDEMNKIKDNYENVLV